MLKCLHTAQTHVCIEWDPTQCYNNWNVLEGITKPIYQQQQLPAKIFGEIEKEKASEARELLSSLDPGKLSFFETDLHCSFKGR